MAYDVQSWEERIIEHKRAQIVSAPPAHAGIVRALNDCFAKPTVLPEELRRLLDRLS